MNIVKFLTPILKNVCEWLLLGEEDYCFAIRKLRQSLTSIHLEKARSEVRKLNTLSFLKNLPNFHYIYSVEVLRTVAYLSGTGK